MIFHHIKNLSANLRYSRFMLFMHKKHEKNKFEINEISDFLCDNFITGNAHFKMCVEKSKNGFKKNKKENIYKKDNLISIKNKSEKSYFFHDFS